MLAAFLTTIFFSISVVCGSRASKLIGGTEANFWRLACATLLLGIFAHWWGQGLAGESFPIFFWSGIIGIGVGDVALFQALPRLGSRLTLLLLQCLTAPFAALIEWLWLGTTLTLAQMICGLVILGGVVIALSPDEHLHIPRKTFWNGFIASIIAAFGNAYGMVLSRKAYTIVHMGGPHIDGATAAYQRLIGGLFVSGICLLVVKRQVVRTQLRLATAGIDETTREKWRRVWPWILVNGVAGQTLGVSCLQWALERYPTGIVLPIIAITPLVVIPFARVLEGEPQPTARSFIGCVIAVGGAVGLTLVK